jgi:flagellar biogenesis protein FliO
MRLGHVNSLNKLFLASIFGIVLISQESFSAILRDIKVIDNQGIELTLDKPVSRNQLDIEFLRDIVQLNLTGVTVYPAKVMSSSDAVINKVFAYQYTPSLVRCRLTVSGKAEDYKNQFKISVDGRKVFVRYLGLDTKTKIDPVVSAPISVQTAPIAPVAVVTSQSAPSIEIPSKPSSNQIAPISKNTNPSPIRGFLTLFLVVFGGLLFAGIAYWMIKRSRGAKGALDGIKKKMGFGKNAKYIGPKKSIAMIRVQGRVFLVGITEQSINLLSQLDSDGEFEEELGMTEKQTDSALNLSSSGAQAAGSPIFETLREKAETDFGIRERIRSKLSGMKQL